MDAQLIRNCFDQGLFGIEIAEQYGGSNLSFMNAILVVEELAKIDPSVSVMVDIQNTLINRILDKYGSEKQKQYWLPKLATEIVGSFCLSEPSSGSDAFALKTRAQQKGDHFVLNGSKCWISNAKGL